MHILYLSIDTIETKEEMYILISGALDYQGTSNVILR